MTRLLFLSLLELAKVFGDYDKTTTPGCAISIVQKSQVLQEAAFGMASLELHVRNSPDTVFHAGSIAKQFTAMAILLLEKDGKVSLADSIRKYVPELPAYAQAVTLEQLLHHTSGVRDAGELLWMAGGKDDARVTDKVVLDLLARQRALNFVPGTRFSYSNSGYMLLALVVQRAGGASLRDFAASRIFAPLGMTRTQFRDDYGSIIDGRATGYRPQPGGGWRLGVYLADTYGDGGLFTTVADLQKWQANFDAPVVGNGTIVRTLQTEGVLRSGEKTGWGMGLRVADRTIGHEGRDFGYQSDLVRFPASGLSIVTLCNARDIDAYTLARQVAAIVDPPPPAPPLPAAGATGETPAPQQVDVKDVGRFAGTYWNPVTLAVRRVEVRDGKPVWARGSGTELIPIGDARFQLGAQPTEIVFDGEGLRVLSSGRPAASYRRVQPFPAASLAQYAGTYESDEVGATYTITGSADGLAFRSGPMFGFDARPVFADTFEIAEGMVIQFALDARGRVKGFAISTDRARDVQFARRP